MEHVHGSTALRLKGHAEDPERSMQSSRSRAKAAVRDIALCNRFGYFFTGTLSRDETDRYPEAAIVADQLLISRSAVT